MANKKSLLRRLIRILITLVAIVVVGVILWAVVDATGGASARTVWNHTWHDESGRTHGAYLAQPDSPRGTPRPGVLLIHEWWGLNLEIARLAEALAADGYVVLAPDSFRGKLSVSVPGALFQLVTTPQDRIAEDLDAALQHLRELDAVDPDRIGVAGFCFGGTQAMNLDIRNDNIAATAIFYGSGIITDEAEVGKLGADGPVLGVFGEEDGSIPPDQIEGFRRALQGQGVDVRIRVYPGVGHAFVNPGSVIAGGPARQAWDLLRTFLRDNL